MKPEPEACEARQLLTRVSRAHHLVRRLFWPWAHREIPASNTILSGDARRLYGRVSSAIESCCDRRNRGLAARISNHVDDRQASKDWTAAMMLDVERGEFLLDIRPSCIAGGNMTDVKVS